MSAALQGVADEAAAALLAQKDKADIAAGRATTKVALLHFFELAARHGHCAAPPCAAYLLELAKPR